MYNPEKQGRTAGGKFGGKIKADVQAVGADLTKLAGDVGEAVDATAIRPTIKATNDAINRALPGEFVVLDDPFDYPAGSPSWGKITLAIIILALIAYVLFV